MCSFQATKYIYWGTVVSAKLPLLHIKQSYIYRYTAHGSVWLSYHFCMRPSLYQYELWTCLVDHTNILFPALRNKNVILCFTNTTCMKRVCADSEIRNIWYMDFVFIFKEIKGTLSGQFKRKIKSYEFSKKLLITIIRLK